MMTSILDPEIWQCGTISYWEHRQKEVCIRFTACVHCTM